MLLELINKYIYNMLESNPKIPGITASLIYDQTKLWSSNVGYADLEGKVPLTQNSIFRIGSITKLFTVVLMMKLRDAGKLNLDDPVSRFIPEIALPIIPGEKTITLRQLASHSSGLPREFEMDYNTSKIFPDIDVLLEQLECITPIHLPYKKCHYSNVGYTLLGHTLEVAGGRKYAELIEEHVTSPLGMKNTFCDIPESCEKSPVTGYIYGPQHSTRKAEQFHLNGLSPCGQMYSSAEDLSRFLSLQFHEGGVCDRSILSGSTIRETYSPITLEQNWKYAYGLGWVLEHVEGYNWVLNRAQIDGYNSLIFTVPELKLGMVALTNSNENIYDPFYNLFKKIVPTISTLKNNSEARYFSNTPLKAYTGTYYNDVHNIEFYEKNGHLWMVQYEHEKSKLLPISRNSFRIQEGIGEGEKVYFSGQNGKLFSSIHISGYRFERYQN